MSGIEATKAEIEMKDGRIAAARALCEKQLEIVNGHLSDRQGDSISEELSYAYGRY